MAFTTRPCTAIRRDACRGSNRVPGEDACDAAVIDPAPFDPTCDYFPVCGRLNVVVLCVAPGQPIPGVLFAVEPPVVNAPPVTTISAGMPFGVQLAGRPVGIPTSVNALPDTEVVRALKVRFGLVAKDAPVITFNLPGTNVPGACYKEGAGTVYAYANPGGTAGGRPGGAQASLSFIYRWCAPLLGCAGASTADVPVFEVTGCTSKGITLINLDSSSFLSTNRCQESYVVLLVQQSCPGPVDATPATIPACIPTSLATEDVYHLAACTACASGPASG
jgi:hypothetical protein